MSIVKHKRGSAPEVSARREAELKALADKPDREIDYSDIPATEDDRWAGAVRGKFYRPLKTQASVRIDADVMEWLKRPGKGYQTRLNAILREAMLRDQNKNNTGSVRLPFLSEDFCHYPPQHPPTKPHQHHPRRALYQPERTAELSLNRR